MLSSRAESFRPVRPVIRMPSLPSWPLMFKLARWALPLAALAIGWMSLTSARESDIGQYGLIQALPPLYIFSLGLLGVSFLLAWQGAQPRFAEFVLSLVALVALLQGAPGVIESEPRFGVAWLHAGFTNFVAQTGTVLPGVDARFSWPSFFTGMALLSRTAGLPNALILVRWWPVAINLLYLPPLYLLAKTLLRDQKRAMLAVWLFPFANWVGQDYYSPQSVAYLLYLVLLCVMLGQYGASQESLISRLWKKVRDRIQARPASREPKEAADGWRPQAPAYAATLLAVMLVLCAAIDTGHQLTPIFAVAVVALLIIFGRTRLLPWAGVMFLLAAGWICYGAISFWAGHFSAVFGGLDTVSTNYTGDLRLHGNLAHDHVNDVRLLIVAVIFALAIVGFFMARKTRADRVAAAVLMLTPVFTIAGQSYGGEAGLRAFLFSLPGALCLAAIALTSVRLGLRPVLAGALTLALIPAFLVARWGNELAELIRPGEISAMNELYRVAPAGSTMMSLTPQITWDYADIGKYHYASSNIGQFAIAGTGPVPLPDPKRLVTGLASRLALNSYGGYLIITESQLEYGQLAYGFPASWGPAVEQQLKQSRLFRLIYSNSVSEIYQVQERYDPNERHFPIRGARPTT